MRIQNPITNWVSSLVRSGYEGFELFRREATGSKLVKRFVVSDDAADSIFEAAKLSAGPAGAAFFVRGVKADADPPRCRSFCLAPTTMEHLRVRSRLRIVLEQVDQEGQVVGQVVVMNIPLGEPPRDIQL